MRPASLRTSRRPAMSSRGLALHRPRTPVWSRVPETQARLRASDLVLALAAVIVLGALALAVATHLAGLTR